MEAVELAAGQRRDVSGDGTGSKKLVTTVALGARFRVPTVPWECQRCTCDAKLRLMSLTLQAATADFLAAMRAKSPSTRATYGTGLRRFVAWRGPETTLAELDDGLLERFYLDLVDEFGRERQATISTYLAAVRAFLRHCLRSGSLGGLELERAVERLRAVRDKPGYRTPRVENGLALIVDYVKNELPSLVADSASADVRLRVYRDRALLLLLFTTGMRRREVARLDRRDVDDGRARQALITGKGDRERVVFFDDDAREAIRGYLDARHDAYAPLFIRHHGKPKNPGRAGERLRLSPQSIWKIVKTYAAAVGVPATTHDFRHLKATSLLNRGANLSEVQDILGHASPDTTKRIYAHYETARLREAFDRYSPTVEEAAAAARQTRTPAGSR